MNTNQIITNAFSNPASQQMYRDHWPQDPDIYALYTDGKQCGGCSFYAKFNFDWGLCCHAASRHHLETVFEHFTCGAFVNEGWGPHTFTEIEELHCGCGGERVEKFIERMNAETKLRANQPKCSENG